LKIIEQVNHNHQLNQFLQMLWSSLARLACL